MENDLSKKQFDIVLLDGEYMELYSHTPDDEPDLNRKVKKGMLRKYRFKRRRNRKSGRFSNP